MKRSSSLRLALMATALPAALGGCDNPAITGQPAPGDWQAQADCSTAELMRTEACEARLEALLANAPRYGSREDCELANGECAQIDENGRSAWIGPTMGFVGGYLLAEALDEVGDAFERKRRYGGYRGGYRSGTAYPSTARGMPSTDVAAPPPSRAITQSRSGFGSMSSARSSFGG